MSASDSAGGNKHGLAPTESATSTLQEAARFDAARISGAAGPTYLIIFLHGLQSALDTTTGEDIQQAAKTVLDTLSSLWVAAPSSNHAAETSALCSRRPCRGLLCRIHVTLFTRLNGSGLFDAASGWARLALSATTVLETRITAFHLTAAVLKALGHTIPSLASECVHGAIGIFRTTSHPHRLRYAASLTVASCFESCGATFTQGDARDLCKQLRTCLVDKSGIIQKGAAELFNSCFFLHNVPDIDQILSLSFKAQEQSDWQARQQHAHLCSSLLILTQVARAPVLDGPQGAQATGATSQTAGRLNPSDPVPQMQSKSRVATLLPLKSMLQRLTDAYNKAGNTSKGRNNAIQIMALLFIRLGPTYLCEHMPEIWETLVLQLVGGVKGRSSPQQLRIAEGYMSFLIGQLVCRHILRESEQTDMMHFFVGQSSKASSETAMSTQSLAVLRGSLKQLEYLLRSCGRSTVAEDRRIEKALISLSEYPDRITQTRARVCLAAYAQSVTHRLPALMGELTEGLETLLAGRMEQGHGLNTPTSLAGQAEALSSLIAILPSLPMYASRDMCTRAMSVASQLLKTAGDHDLDTSTLIIQSAWEVLGGILSLPQRWMSVHLSQILLLWKNALPKASHREVNIAETRTLQEWTFLLSIRADALHSITCFLKSHAAVRTDSNVSPRIISLLNNATAFNASVPSFRRQADDVSLTAQIVKLELHQSRFLTNLLDAFLLIAHHPLLESSRVALCNISILQITRRDTTVASMQTSLDRGPSADGFWDGTHAVPAIASNSEDGNFDNAAPIFGRERSLAFKEYLIEDIPRKLGSIKTEDMLSSGQNGMSEPGERAAALMDAAAHLFASLFPLLATANQIQYIESLTVHLQSIASMPTRQEKMLSVSLITLLRSVALAAHSMVDMRKTSEPVNESLLVRMCDLLQIGLAHSDSIVRGACSEGVASLCVLGSSSFLSSRIQTAVATIVANTDPFVRSGCVLLFADIYSAVGAIAARPALKTVVDITMTLAADPHPTVHYWSLRALTVIISTAGLDFTPYISSCIGLIININAADSHDSEAGTLATAMLRGDLPIRQAICAVLGCVIAAAGPSLYEAPLPAQAVSALVECFLFDEDIRVVVQAGTALQNLLLVSPTQVITPRLIGILVNQLHSPVLAVQISAVNSIYQIVRRDVLGISRLGGDKLVERLFTILDADPSVSGIKQTITTWMLQTAVSNPTGWLTICQKVLSQDAGNWQVADKQEVRAAFEDEEAQGLRATTDEGGKAAGHGFLARWPTRTFALECLSSLLRYLQGSTDYDRPVDGATPRRSSNAIAKLRTKIPDLIRMALLSSTSPNLDLKLQGLELLQQVIIAFREEVDVQFDNAPLLQQYQASIIAAAAPAFEAGAEPELLVSALKLCGLFVAARTSQTIHDNSRALRLLDNLVECFTSSPQAQTSLVSSNAVRAACAAAWARICVASLRDSALKVIVDARRAPLLDMWREIVMRAGPEPTLNGLASGQVAGDPGENEEPPLLDLESWLLVFKAWTISMSECARQADFSGNFWNLLGDICHCIERHMLAETLQPSAHDTAALTVDCLSSLLKLAVASGAYQHNYGTWHELLQIAYRLYLLDVASIDKQLVTYVAGLAVCTRDESGTPERQAQLQACARIALLVCNRNLREGTEFNIDIAASAWMAVNAICLLSDPSYHSAMLTAPWVLLQRHIPAFRVLELPSSMLSVMQQAAILMANSGCEDTLEGLHPLDNFIASFSCAFERAHTSNQHNQAATAARHYLQVFSIIAGVARTRSGAMSEDVIVTLCKCLRCATRSADKSIMQEGLALTKAFACVPPQYNGPAQLLAARILCEIVPLLGNVERLDNVKSTNVDSRAIVALTVGIGESHRLSRSLMLTLYAWAFSRDSSRDNNALTLAVVNLIHQNGAEFRQAYASLPMSYQQILQEALRQANRDHATTTDVRTAPPTIELKLFS